MPHPALIEPEDINRFLDAVRAGETLVKAAAAANFSLSAIRNRIERDDQLSERYALARQEGAVAKASQVDTRVEELVYAENPAPSTVALWAKRYHPGYRDKVEVVGAYTGPQTAEKRAMVVDLREIATVLRESGITKLTLETAEADGSPEDVSGVGLLPA